MDRETHCREAIARIVEQAKRDAQPYVDELVRLEAMKPRPPFVINRADWDALANPGPTIEQMRRKGLL